MRDNQSTTDGSEAVAADKNQPAAPAISLPKGGGAIRGIGEKFAANPVTGTGSLSVPIFTTPGRAGFGPQLSLTYDSGAGNGPFGFGWQFSIPSITRKTDKGLPRYRDEADSDIFILSGAEDLVPVLNAAGQREKLPRKLNGVDYSVERYCPRIEGLFARIEQWRENQSGQIHWRSISKDNITSIYGASQESQIAGRIADPDDPTHIFSWLLETSYDDKGNVIVYEYKVEDRSRVSASLYEQNRQSSANRYLKRIKYGHQSPYYPDATTPQPVPLPAVWHFQVVFDYGEHDPDKPQVNENIAWPSRPDAFSSYRAGFEIRTYRLCHRVLMFHKFTELGTTPCLVRSTDFAYSHEQNPGNPLNPIYSFLTSVTQTGYVKKTSGSGYDNKSLPQLEFVYTEAKVDESVHFVDPASLENLPAGADGSHYQWVDLDSEGLPGILTEQAEAWFYKRNVSNLPSHGNSVTARFEAMERVATKPSIADLRGDQQLLDLAGDGQLCLVQFSQPVAGFYERDPEGQWQPFTPFAFSPNVEWNNPNLKSIDLNGDGHADILISEDEVFTWYPSREKEGFGPAETVRKAGDEDRGPTLVFADGTQSIYLADLSGDGLTDLVRIRNGEVCYWPNLGYGRFGAKITMDGAPLFDYPDQFDQKRIRLADIDGSGTTDIIYLGRDRVTLYFNQSGNSWSDGRPLAQFPAPDSVASVGVVDLLGNGTACLVWSSPLPGDAGQPMRYIDLMGGQKPHLLISVKNNLGAETKVQYAASTQFYLQDRADGKPWITRLPFPVHVVERVETYDYISQNRFVTRFAYHHGYFDGVEREFRGFGMVEQWDTEEIGALQTGSLTLTSTNIEAASYVPPVHTKTWFHNGAYIAQDNISRHFVKEYYQGDTSARLLDDTILPGGLTAQEEREACRALKGSILRQEIYADDDSPQAELPYSVSERNYTIEPVQPSRPHRHAVFFVHPRETIDYHYERKTADPRIGHQMVLAVDKFGNITKSAAIGYPRRAPAFDEQKPTLITYTEADFTNEVDTGDAYRTPLPYEVRTYELTHIARDTNSVLYALADLLTPVIPPVEIQYEAAPAGNAPQKRLIERIRTLYLKNNLSGPLPSRTVESLALPYESYKQAFTPGLLDVFSSKVARADLVTLLKSQKGGYRDLDGDGVWWIPSGLVFFSPLPKPTPQPITQNLAFARQHFFMPQATQDPFGNVSRMTYDNYTLLVTRAEDAATNVIEATNDYRVMQPKLVTDPNKNRAVVVFDALGLVAGIVMMGEETEPDGQPKGDSLMGFVPDLTDTQVEAFLADPRGEAASLLDQATTRIIYDVHRFQKTGQPVFAATLARETHVSDLPSGKPSIVQVNFSYSDGFGREIQKKIQAEKGEVDGVPVNPRWVGSGWTIFNNKGKPVKQYEPFFSATHAFQFKQEGVSSTLFYDPLERVVATLHPNHIYEKVVFDPWRQETWDVNDTLHPSQRYDPQSPLVLPDHTFNPKDDPDVGPYLRRLPKDEYWPTWYHRRMDAAQALQQWPDTDRQGRNLPQNAQIRAAEKSAARKAAKHAATPSITHLDTLGRPFLTIADNGAADRYETRVKLDIERNQRAVTDALKRQVMTYDYDMLGTKIHQVSMDAGARWLLNDVAGKPLRAWDDRNHEIRHEYDELQRPTSLFVRTGTSADHEVERIVYGESRTNAVALNLRGKVFKRFDGAGVVTHHEYDFKGNLARSTRRLLQNYKDEVDWSLGPALENETFSGSTSYDALNRVVRAKTPDNSIMRPSYNEANLLEQVQVRLRGAAAWTTFVNDIDYDAKGQRELIEYSIKASNGVLKAVQTEYTYDPLTFRLTNLKTTRTTNNMVLQNLSYTYDPVGNITAIRDDAQQKIYFNNQVVTPSAEYVYDAIYRLIGADGREHRGQNASPQVDHDDSPRMHQPQPNNGQLMRNYGEAYKYDEVGNILQMIHQANNGNWTRHYAYEPNSNRLTSTSLPGDPAAGSYSAKYEYDSHGNMIRMPHFANRPLPNMHWDFKDQLHQVDLGGGGTAYYVYDGAGQRVRKVIERQNGTRKEERIYLGGVEIYREYNGNGSTLKLERETLHLMDDKQRIALVETKTRENGTTIVASQPLTRYQLGNHLGSASLELDAAGAIISYEEFYPYGSTSYQAGRNVAEVSLKRYRYTGKERDEESGLYYHGARYYAPWLGRWTSCDPIPFADGPNSYEYVCNQPTKLQDRTGQYAEAGHYYTVYVVALAAGFDPDTARKMAVYAEAPDEITELDAAGSHGAVLLAQNRVFAKENSGKAVSVQERQSIVQLEQHRDKVQRGLHALTGGQAEPERVNRVALVLSLKPGTPEHGLALHSLGDSFTHTIPPAPPASYDNPGPNPNGSQIERQFETGRGHADWPHVLRPDQIRERPKLYGRYVRTLFATLSKQAKDAGIAPRASNKEINDLIESVTSAPGIDAEPVEILRLREFAEQKLGVTLDSWNPELQGARPAANVKSDPNVPLELRNLNIRSAESTAADWANPSGNWTKTRAKSIPFNF